MLWLVSGPGSFLLPFLLPGTFGVDAGRFYAVLPDMSVGKPAARLRNPQSGHKTETSLNQVVAACYWYSRHPQPGYQTSPIQVVIGFLGC